jgi:microcystin degradation protein MlrC
MKRIGIIQIWQESASFNPVLTEIQQYRITDLITDSKKAAAFAKQSCSEITGFVEGFAEWQEPVETVLLFAATAWCAGPLSSNAKQRFVEYVLDGLKHAGKFDGLLVSFHGALLAKDEMDVEGMLLERIRKFLNDDNLPIVSTVDLHAYITPKMLHNTNAIIGYHTNPHVDLVQTGKRASALLNRIYQDAKPTTRIVRLPMIITGESTQLESPILYPVFKLMLEIEHEPEVLSANLIFAQPYIDVPDLGWTTMVTTNSNPQLAQNLATELAQMCWQRRNLLAHEFTFYSAKECISKALEIEGKPVVIADGADSMNSGAPGDSIHLLKAMIERNIPEQTLTIMVDPQAVEHARKVGENGKFVFSVGGKRDNVFSQPLPVRGKVLYLRPAKYIYREGHAAGNWPIDMGIGAVVKIGSVFLLLVERSGPGGTPMMYRCVGLEPKDFKIVIVKSPAGFRPFFEPFAAEILLSACPGCANPYLNQLPYKKISRPLWPLDKIENWHDIDWCGKITNYHISKE